MAIGRAVRGRSCSTGRWLLMVISLVGSLVWSSQKTGGRGARDEIAAPADIGLSRRATYPARARPPTRGMHSCHTRWTRRSYGRSGDHGGIQDNSVSRAVLPDSNRSATRRSRGRTACPRLLGFSAWIAGLALTTPPPCPPTRPSPGSSPASECPCRPHAPSSRGAVSSLDRALSMASVRSSSDIDRHVQR